jgi:CHAD domain-containing protein
MSYRLENNESLSFGLKRITLELIDKSIFNLSKGNGSFNEDIHDTRKNFKKIRTVLRLVRTNLGDKGFRNENLFYRDSGRKLSDLRDSTVLINTFDKLLKTPELESAKYDFSLFRNFLIEKHKSISLTKNKKSVFISSLTADLILARSRVFDWSFSGDSFLIIKKDLRRIYKKGQEMMFVVSEDEIRENVHEWRKRVKDLWHTLRILNNIWSEIMVPLVSLLEKLSDTLGEANDLYLLKEKFISNEHKLKDNQSAKELLIFIDKRIIDLLREARNHGKKIYSENPKFFAGRIKNYFEIWRSEYSPLKYSSI